MVPERSLDSHPNDSWLYPPSQKGESRSPLDSDRSYPFETAPVFCRFLRERVVAATVVNKGRARKPPICSVVISTS